MDSATPNFPQFSLVIPTCNRPALLSHCLDRITPKAQKFDADAYKVIVTDDGSQQHQTDQSLKANYPWVTWIEGPRRGPAANRNHGASLAKSEWILFCDDDCLPDTNYLRAYAHAQTLHRDCEVFEGRTIADREKRHPLEESPINSKGGNLWSCNFAIRRKLFEEMGGFDEKFPYAAVEDMEFRVRLQKAGVQMVFLENAMVVHPWRKLSATDYLKQQAKHRNSHLILMQRHPEFRSVFTTGNVVRDIVRYYVQQWTADLALCGLQAVLYQPLFLWCQLQRIFTYRFGVPPIGAVAAVPSG